MNSLPFTPGTVVEDESGNAFTVVNPRQRTVRSVVTKEVFTVPEGESLKELPDVRERR